MRMRSPKPCTSMYVGYWTPMATLRRCALKTCLCISSNPMRELSNGRRRSGAKTQSMQCIWAWSDATVCPRPGPEIQNPTTGLLATARVTRRAARKAPSLLAAATLGNVDHPRLQLISCFRKGSCYVPWCTVSGLGVWVLGFRSCGQGLGLEVTKPTQTPKPKWPMRTPI